MYPPSGNAAIARSGLSVCAFRRSASPYLFGGSCSCRAKSSGVGKRAARMRIHFFRTRAKCGGGGPREARWRGLLTRRFIFVEGGSSPPRPPPLTPPRHSRCEWGEGDDVERACTAVHSR